MEVYARAHHTCMHTVAMYMYDNGCYKTVNVMSIIATVILHVQYKILQHVTKLKVGTVYCTVQLSLVHVVHVHVVRTHVCVVHTCAPHVHHVFKKKQKMLLHLSH